MLFVMNILFWLLKKMIKKYKKRPVVIEAVQFEYTAECLLFLKDWLGDY